MPNPTYYRGDLAADLMAAALVAIEQSGPAAVSIRSLARDVGVSHAAPKAHFSDKSALFAAIATDGFRGLGDALRSAQGTDAVARLAEGGVAYVDYALEHPAHFAVMWRPDLFTLTADLAEARLFAREGLIALVDSADDALRADRANQAWALAHGWASLLLAGAFDPGNEAPLDYVRRQLIRVASIDIDGPHH